MKQETLEAIQEPSPDRAGSVRRINTAHIDTANQASIETVHAGRPLCGNFLIVLNIRFKLVV